MKSHRDGQAPSPVAVRCPFRTARYGGRDMTLCPGFRADLRWIGLFQARDLAVVCTHLVGAPHPLRASRIAACAHPDARWIDASARRILDDAVIRASLTPSPPATLTLRERARTACARSALLCGRARTNAILLGLAPIYELPAS